MKGGRKGPVSPVLNHQLSVPPTDGTLARAVNTGHPQLCAAVGTCHNTYRLDCHIDFYVTNYGPYFLTRGICNLQPAGAGCDHLRQQRDSLFLSCSLVFVPVCSCRYHQQLLSMPFLFAYLAPSGPAGSPVGGDGASFSHRAGTSQQQGDHLEAQAPWKSSTLQRRPIVSLLSLSALGFTLVLAYIIAQCFKALTAEKNTQTYGRGARILAEGGDDQCSVSFLLQKGGLCGTETISRLSPWKPTGFHAWECGSTSAQFNPE